MQPAPDAEPSPAAMHLAFPTSPPAIRDGLARLLAGIPLSGLSDAARGTAELVLAEVLNNIAEHAYAGQAGTVTVTLRASGQGIRCLVIDRGAPLPGGEPPRGDTPDRAGLALADLPEGGFGWHLIRSLTRDLVYARIAGTNRLGFLLPWDSDPP